MERSCVFDSVAMISLGDLFVGARPETAQVSAGVWKKPEDSSSLASDLRNSIGGDNSAVYIWTDHISLSQQTSTRRPKHIFEASTKNDTKNSNYQDTCRIQCPGLSSETPSQAEASFRFQRLSGTTADELQYLGANRYEQALGV